LLPYCFEFTNTTPQNTYMPYISRKDKNDTRLTIIDPNRPDNNISGGTNQITEIVKCFSSAHQSLMLRLEHYEQRTAQSLNSSFLECLVGGNFAQYEMQRHVLHSLSLKLAPVPKWLAPPKTLPNKPKTNGVSATPAVSSGLSKNSLPARPSSGLKNVRY
jgi:non-canonical poly(A) RNA polymerase PAPD5/7